MAPGMCPTDTGAKGENLALPGGVGKTMLTNERMCVPPVCAIQKEVAHCRLIVEGYLR